MNERKLLAEKTLNSGEVFNGKLLHVFFDEVKLPDGSTSTREWIRHPGACAVVPVCQNGDLIMLRQFRYPLDKIFWEVPAGKIDKGEDKEQTASRELLEETGARAQHFSHVGHFYPAIGYSNEVIHIYVAWDLDIAGQDEDDDEFVLQKRLPFPKAVDMVHSGEISDGKSVICLLRAWEWWQKNQPFSIEK